MAKEEAAAAKQELEQGRSHMETIESKLQAALLEVEFMKASEESARSQVSGAYIPVLAWRSSSLDHSWYACVMLKDRCAYCEGVVLGDAMVMLTCSVSLLLKAFADSPGSWRV